MKLTREVIIRSPSRGYTTTAPAGAEVVEVPGQGYALARPTLYGACTHDAIHYWFWVPRDAVTEG